MKKIVLVLLGLTSLAGFAVNSVAAQASVNAKKDQQLATEHAVFVNSTVLAAVQAATTTVGASVVSGTIISHIG